MTKPFNRISILVFSICLLSIYSCQKETADETKPDKTHFQVRLTDAPGNFSEVNIDIQQIRIHSDVSGWIDLKTRAGIYNILDLANGIDTVLAGDTVPSGQISQIRFILGENNTVVVDGQSHALSTPSASQSGLKLNLHENLSPGVNYSILIDFDAAQSIVKTGNGKYILKPVLRVIAEGVDGTIKGDLDPDGVFAHILAIKGNDIYGSIPNLKGEFQINGLEEGNYMVCTLPMIPYRNDTLYSVQVHAGTVTDLGPIQLQ